MKNNYNFDYVKFHFGRGYIQRVCALASKIKLFLSKFNSFPTRSLV